MEYPQWVTRAQGIGPVLCHSEAEKLKLLADWEAEQRASTETVEEETEFEEIQLPKHKPKHK